MTKEELKEKIENSANSQLSIVAGAFVGELLGHKNHFKQKWSFLPSVFCHSTVSFTYYFCFNV